METELTIEGGGFPPFSARACHQVLTPIRNGEYRRTLDGKLTFLGDDSYQKYRTKIKGQDKTMPSLDKWWQGQVVQVGCIQRLCQEYLSDGMGKTIKLMRPPIEGSIIIFDDAQEIYPLDKIKENEVTLKKILPIGKRVFISYRPSLTMMMTHHSVQTDEWGHQVGWVIEFEEV